MTAATLTHGVALAFAAVFVCSLNVKLSTLIRREAAVEPLLAARSVTRSHATGFLAAVSATEVGVVVLLIGLPTAGLACATGLLALYEVVLLTTNTADCNCFGRAWRAPSRSYAVVRTAILSAGAFFAAALGSSTSSHADTPTSIAVAALFLAIPAGLVFLAHSAKDTTTNGGVGP